MHAHGQNFELERQRGRVHGTSRHEPRRPSHVAEPLPRRRDGVRESCADRRHHRRASSRPCPMKTAASASCVTNDDGIHARALPAWRQLHADGTYDVRSVAPHTEQSACGHSITLSGNLEARTAADGRTPGPADDVRAGRVSPRAGRLRQADDDVGAARRLVAAAARRLRHQPRAEFWAVHRRVGHVRGGAAASWQGFPSIAASLDCFARDADTRRRQRRYCP